MYLMNHMNRLIVIPTMYQTLHAVHQMMTVALSPLVWKSHCQGSNFQHFPTNCRSPIQIHTAVALQYLQHPLQHQNEYMTKSSTVFFCQKSLQKIARQLLSMHGNESDVAKAAMYPKNSKEHRFAVKPTLKARGVIQQRSGEMVACDQPCQSKTSQHFIRCIYFQGLYTRKKRKKNSKKKHYGNMLGSVHWSWKITKDLKVLESLSILSLLFQHQ